MRVGVAEAVGVVVVPQAAVDGHLLALLDVPDYLCALSALATQSKVLVMQVLLRLSVTTSLKVACCLSVSMIGFVARPISITLFLIVLISFVPF